ncbi:MAG TPA: PhzF family phenazine biosynthesis protein [Casimicrobiaceae bacterium]|nr:PhzF family phenazine biosynthesis protein [Casimicrobiaceae bacterium]
MKRYAFRIVNVFAEERLGGNPLAVFEDARGLDEAAMQALALQFNLSETTFILPSETGTARVRIFTPTFEMPFAGHPTLGTAHVVRALKGGDHVTLEMRAGFIPVRGAEDRWTLQANAPRTRTVAASRDELAAMLGLEPPDIGANPLWVDTGSEQLIVPLAGAAAVRRAQPKAELMSRHATVALAGAASRSMAYIWTEVAPNAALARFFFLKQGSVVEDPGTGSACANLGGWLVATGAALPRELAIAQGDAVGRSCRLGLTVDADKRIFVSGRVIELGRGTIEL